MPLWSQNLETRSRRMRRLSRLPSALQLEARPGNMSMRGSQERRKRRGKKSHSMVQGNFFTDCIFILTWNIQGPHQCYQENESILISLIATKLVISWIILILPCNLNYVSLIKILSIVSIDLRISMTFGNLVTNFCLKDQCFDIVTTLIQCYISLIKPTS